MIYEESYYYLQDQQDAKDVGQKTYWIIDDGVEFFAEHTREKARETKKLLAIKGKIRKIEVK